MPIEMPPTSKALGRKVVVFLEAAPAAASGIPTLAEVNAAFFASLHLYTPFNATPNQNTGQGPRKLGSEISPTENGLVTYPPVDVEYSYKPQTVATAGSVGNELYQLLVAGTMRTAVIFDDLPGNIDEIPANSVGDVVLIDPGVRRKGATGDDEFAKASVKQSLVVAGGEPIAVDHVFAA